MSKYACWYCKKDIKYESWLQWCKKCASVYYCGSGCQDADWKSHKKECNTELKQSQKESFEIFRRITRYIVLQEKISALCYMFRDEPQGLIFFVSQNDEMYGISCDKAVNHVENDPIQSENEYGCMYIIQGYKDVIHFQSSLKSRCKELYLNNVLHNDGEKVVLPYTIYQIKNRMEYIM